MISKKNNIASLTIWDVDDTLFNTTAGVVLHSPNATPRKLASDEFINYTLKPNEHFDFSQYEDAKLFYDTSVPIKNIWKTALKTLEKIGKHPGSRMVIVTARRELDDMDLFKETFHQHGMDMSKVSIFTVSGSANKKPVIRELLKQGNYTNTRLFDDHQQNLEDFLSLKQEFPHITFQAFPVGKNGIIGNPIIL